MNWKTVLLSCTGTYGQIVLVEISHQIGWLLPGSDSFRSHNEELSGFQVKILQLLILLLRFIDFFEAYGRGYDDFLSRDKVLATRLLLPNMWGMSVVNWLMESSSRNCLCDALSDRCLKAYVRGFWLVFITKLRPSIRCRKYYIPSWIANNS